MYTKNIAPGAEVLADGSAGCNIFCIHLLRLLIFKHFQQCILRDYNSPPNPN